ncbi:ATP-dependent helicase [Escherichia coli]|uniref:ATP-dependent helicase n=1 Tax=Escherichia coli TaxID=562 RepID=A0A376TG67_ECOLX|nr:ATP-dependent helicase [Escherichia coli]
MGAVDLVIQVANAAFCCQWVTTHWSRRTSGGGVSKGLFFPRTRRDLVDSAVIVECMFAGRLEKPDTAA